MSEYLNRTIAIGDVMRALTIEKPIERGYYQVHPRQGGNYTLESLDKRGGQFPNTLFADLEGLMRGQINRFNIQRLSPRARRKVLRRFGLTEPEDIHTATALVDYGMPKGSYYAGMPLSEALHGSVVDTASVTRLTAIVDPVGSRLSEFQERLDRERLLALTQLGLLRI